MELELRQVPGLEVRADKGDGVVRIAGRGVPYGEWSEDLGGFRERLMPGTFRESIADDDIRAIFNHNTDLVIGRRSAGTLRLEEAERGISYEADAPDAQWARDMAVSIQRQDITGNSFGFWVEDVKDQEWEERDGIMWRTIRRARLRELGPQTFPAYPQSDVSVRSAQAVLKDAAAWMREHRGVSADLLRRRLELGEQEARAAVGA